MDENRDLTTELFKIGLLDIGTQDEEKRLGYIKLAVKDITRDLLEHPDKILSFTRATLNPYVVYGHPVLKEVEDFITKHWIAMRRTHAQNPQRILKDIMLLVLWEIGKKNNTGMIYAIYLTVKNLLRYVELGKEKELIIEAFTNMGIMCEKEAKLCWSFQKNSIELSYNSLFEETQIDEGDVDREFSEEKMIKKINSSFNQVSRSLLTSDKRSQLLWWKESLYSESKRKSYREISSPQLATLVMVFDLFELVRFLTIVPESVEYFFLETFYLVQSDKDEIKLSEHLGILAENKASLKTYLKKSSENLSLENGCFSLLEFLSQLINDQILLDTLEEKTGLPLDKEMKISELALMVFRDLLAKESLN